MTRGRDWRITAALLWEHMPRLAVASDVPIVVVNAARPGLTAYVTAGFVNAMVAGHGLLPWVGAFVALQVLEEITNNFGNGVVQGWMHQSIVLRVRTRLLNSVAHVPLVRLMDSSYADGVARADEELGDRLGRLLRSLLYLLNSVLALAGALAALLVLGAGLILPVVLVCGAAVGAWISGQLAQVDVAYSQGIARPGRVAAAWSDVLTSHGAAAELRLLQSDSWVLRQWRAAYAHGAREAMTAARARTRWACCDSSAAVVTWVVLLIVAGGAAVAAGPATGAGVFTGMLTAASMVEGNFRSVAGSFARIRRHSRVAADLARVLGADMQGPPRPSMEPRTRTDGGGAPVEVVAERVTFRYPGAAGNAVENVTFRIGAGQTFAIVGPNGAGKSTLAALLLGLHTPTEGRIVVRSPGGSGGGPHPEAAPERGAVLQQFARYSLSLRDNVGFGHLPSLEDDDRLREALRKAGSVEGLDLDDWLGPEFGGRELSGGEWLRVAIARGIVGDRPFLVLDEPTAALDPTTEVDVLERLLDMGTMRTRVIVSHRLGFARTADRILVMMSGRVVEDGTHDELLRCDGLYAQMWRAQASWYS